jgi:hypothetical protein
LWVFAVLSAPLPPRSGRGVGAVPESVRTRLIEQARTVIEVFDPTRGVLIASQSYAGAYIGFGDGFAARANEEPPHLGSIDIFRVRLISQR